MQKINDWENVQESGNSRITLPAGGYVCKIVDVKDEPQKQYLRIEYDIAQGEFKDYSLNCEERNGFWPLSFIKSYKEKAIGFFKHFISSVEKSNNNFKWAWDEDALVGKLVGIVIGEEEYEKRNGNTGTRMVAADFCSVTDIKNGNFRVPPPVRLAPKTTTPPVVDDGDLPFDFN